MRDQEVPAPRSRTKWDAYLLSQDVRGARRTNLLKDSRCNVGPRIICCAVLYP